MVEHKKDVVEIPVGKYVENVRKNPWMLSTLVLVIVLIVMIFVKSGGVGITSVGKDKAAGNLLSFVNGLGNGEAKLVSSEQEGALYKVTVNYQGQDVPVYVSLDGKYLISQPIPLDGTASAGNTQTPPAKNVQKSDKPKVELFVMSYCPYGTQMEKGILPVVALLKDKIDFTLRYTHFTRHGEKEDTEDFRQLCIREEQGSKFLPYVQCILNSSNVNAPADVNECMKSLKIDSAKVNSCMTTKAKDYYAVDSGLSKGYGVQGSPTLVVNGVQADSGRSPSAVLSTICSAFNNAPSECSQTLPSESPSAGFGFNSASSSESAAANCVV